MTANLTRIRALPDWVPSAVRIYLAHTEGGRSLRDIARREGVHASTVLRQVRRFESRRDDPLVDCALGRLKGAEEEAAPATRREAPAAGPAADAASVLAGALPPDDRHLMDEARRLLPLMAQPGTMLVVAPDMEKAIVLRDAEAGGVRLAVLDRPVAEAFALREWIACCKAGRVSQYTLAAEGRGLLRQMGASAGRGRFGAGSADESETRFRPPPESPVAVLARRRDRDGRPFLDARLLAAAERLREDFEIAQMEPRSTQDWERMLGGARDGGPPGSGPVPGATPAAARARVITALQVLGPGLGDMALRCCCWQEGLETAERHLGWSARSGKIVLRIALERLWRHYEELGEAGKLIG